MAILIDEVSVLRDAHWLGLQNLDLCPEENEPDFAIAKSLHESGLLEISAAGEILGKPLYRLTEKGRPLAAECYAIVKADRDELRLRVALSLIGAV